jgi:phenylalanyl-tRNA synthetase alpha chain
MAMEDDLQALLEQVKVGAEAATTEHELEQLKLRFFGKKGELTTVLRQMGKVPAADRPKIGQLVNTVRDEMQSILTQREAVLGAELMAAKLEAEKIDLTLPGRGRSRGSLHPLTAIRERVTELFSTMGFRVAEGPEIENEYYNFEALNIPANHPARAMQDTFYIDGQHLLRTQTSPVQIREMQTEGAPIRLIAPGRVYRRDSDQTHTPMFHQMEGLLVDKQCSFGQLKGLLQDFMRQFFGADLELRFRPSYFPFTEPSAEVDIRSPKTGEWLEVLGCGMVHPNVLRQVDLDPDEFIGFAFGMGLDRLAMLYYGIPDLRMMFANDLQFLQQF